MSTAVTYRTKSTSSESTEQLGAQLGARLRGGEIIALSSDLGGGKTTFVRGMARGMGSTDHVSSPTFTIGREYRAASRGLTLYHFDFYRLQEAGLIAHELAEVLDDPEAAVVVEWGDIVEDVLPDTKMVIAITLTGETTRQFSFSYPKQLDYLREGLPAEVSSPEPAC